VCKDPNLSGESSRELRELSMADPVRSSLPHVPVSLPGISWTSPLTLLSKRTHPSSVCGSPTPSTHPPTRSPARPDFKILQGRYSIKEVWAVLGRVPAVHMGLSSVLWGFRPSLPGSRPSLSGVDLPCSLFSHWGSRIPYSWIAPSWVRNAPIQTRALLTRIGNS
jgi:hypothetical protein